MIPNDLSNLGCEEDVFTATHVNVPQHRRVCSFGSWDPDSGLPIVSYEDIPIEYENQDDGNIGSLRNDEDFLSNLPEDSFGQEWAQHRLRDHRRYLAVRGYILPDHNESTESSFQFGNDALTQPQVAEDQDVEMMESSTSSHDDLYAATSPIQGDDGGGNIHDSSGDSIYQAASNSELTSTSPMQMSEMRRDVVMDDGVTDVGNSNPNILGNRATDKGTTDNPTNGNSRTLHNRAFEGRIARENIREGNEDFVSKQEDPMHPEYSELPGLMVPRMTTGASYGAGGSLSRETMNLRLHNAGVNEERNEDDPQHQGVNGYVAFSDAVSTLSIPWGSTVKLATNLQRQRYVDKLKRKWSEKNGELPSGCRIDIPSGYTFVNIERADKTTRSEDLYLYGHPSHYKFRSVKEFYPHLEFLIRKWSRDGGDQCKCKGCQKLRRQIGLGIGGQGGQADMRDRPGFLAEVGLESN